MMQKLVFLFLLSLSAIDALCQQQYFVYIQADEQQPFYAKLNNKIYSSSEKGYMIIPKLEDKTHELTIGFPKSQVPEQRFTITLDNKDQGFQLKRFEDKGWGLFNLQTMAVSMNAGAADKPTEEISGVKKTDAFSELLANVVNDSAILYSAAKPKPQVVQKETTTAKQATVPNTDTVTSMVAAAQPVQKDAAEVPVKQDVPAGAAKKDSVSAATGTGNETAKSNDVAKNQEEKKQSGNIRTLPEKPFISKIKEEKSADLYTATYLEQYIYSTDTIRISIPLSEQASTTAVAVEKTTEPKTAKEENTVVSPAAVPDTVTRKSTVVLLNSDCKKIASENDLDKLRVKLLNDKTIDDKISTSKKYFKSRCLMVKQVRALSELFPTDETKLRFFETAYPFVSDTGNFVLLEELVANEFYKTQFKAMLQR